MVMDIQHNIRKIYVIGAANQALFFAAVLVPLFIEAGLSVGQTFILESIFALTLMITEIPSGYLSDRWGRRNTLSVGGIFGLLGLMVFAFAQNLLSFAMAEVLLALGVSFFSGTTEAILYETLSEMHATDKYSQIFGRQQFIGFITAAAAALLGGVMGAISLRGTLWLTMIPYLLALVAVLLLQEPKRHKLEGTQHLKSMVKILKGAFAHDIRLRSAVLVFSSLSVMFLILAWFAQPYQIKAGLPITLFGFAYAFMMMGSGLGAKWSYFLQRKFSDRSLLLFSATTIVVSLVSLGNAAALWGIGLFIIARVASGLIRPVMSNTINSMTDSDVRATILSAQSFVTSLGFVVVSAVVGYVTDRIGFSQTMVFLGFIAGLTLILLYVPLRKVLTT